MYGITECSIKMGLRKEKTMLTKTDGIQILLTVFILFQGIDVQSQWVQQKGRGYYEGGVWWLEADAHYTNVGKIDPNATRGLFITSFFGRYGLTNKVTLVGYFPHVRVYQNRQVYSSGRTPLPGEQFSSLGDINLGMEFQWFQKKGWAISSSLTFGLPTGNQRGGSDGSYQTGDGEFNQIFRFHLGRSYRLASQRFYAKVNVGVNQRSLGFSDEFRAGFETGTKIVSKKVLILGRVNLIESFQNGTLDASTSNGSIFANNVEVVNVGGALIVDLFKDWNLSFGASYPVRGRVLYRAPAWSSGLSLQL